MPSPASTRCQSWSGSGRPRPPSCAAHPVAAGTPSAPALQQLGQVGSNGGSADELTRREPGNKLEAGVAAGRALSSVLRPAAAPVQMLTVPAACCGSRPVIASSTCRCHPIRERTG